MPGLYGSAVEYTAWSDGGEPAAGRALPAGERARLERRASELSAWVRRYLGTVAPGPSRDPRVLDAIWAAWLDDRDPDRLALEETVAALGAAFGFALCEAFAMHWIELPDGSGTVCAVRSADRRITVCPEWVIRKRVATRGRQPFGDVFAFVRSQLGRDGGIVV